MFIAQLIAIQPLNVICSTQRLNTAPNLNNMYMYCANQISGFLRRSNDFAFACFEHHLIKTKAMAYKRAK